MGVEQIPQKHRGRSRGMMMRGRSGLSQRSFIIHHTAPPPLPLPLRPGLCFFITLFGFLCSHSPRPNFLNCFLDTFSSLFSFLHVLCLPLVFVHALKNKLWLPFRGLCRPLFSGFFCVGQSNDCVFVIQSLKDKKKILTIINQILCSLVDTK